jgi:hypothetical protein
VNGEQFGASITSLGDLVGVGIADIAVGAGGDGAVYVMFLEPVHSGGDYNVDGIADAADYVLWRKTLGAGPVQPYAGADGDGDGFVTADDLDVWATNFGTVFPPAGGAGDTAIVQAAPDGAATAAPIAVERSSRSTEAKTARLSQDFATELNRHSQFAVSRLPARMPRFEWSPSTDNHLLLLLARDRIAEAFPQEVSIVADLGEGERELDVPADIDNAPNPVDLVLADWR